MGLLLNCGGAENHNLIYLEIKDALGVGCGQGSDDNTDRSMVIWSAVGCVAFKPRDLGNDRGYKAVAPRSIVTRRGGRAE
jgi:hypothetical protein